MANNDLTAQRLRELLNYCPETGRFTWRVRAASKAAAGSIAGGPDSSGYVKIGIDGRDYRAQRLAWLYVHGKWPDGQIDHIDGCPSNNALRNLRDVSQFMNQHNQRSAHADSTHGFMGVTRRKTGWIARINIDGACRYLGIFRSPEAAHEAYIAAKRSHQAGCTI